MDKENRDEPIEDASAETGNDAANPGLTPEDEEVLLKRLRELGYVE